MLTGAAGQDWFLARLAGTTRDILTGRLTAEFADDLVEPTPGGSVPPDPGTIGPLSVNVDCKPGTFPNTINLKAKGVLPVAILSTSTFDATTVNVGTLKLNGSGPPARSVIEDVNGDGLPDVSLSWRIPDLVASGALKPNTTTVVLSGKTSTGTAISGSDSVQIV